MGSLGGSSGSFGASFLASARVQSRLFSSGAEGLVGSRRLAMHAGRDLSSASIRNVMLGLENMGLGCSPHTSAGRVPTARGYRVFVDNLLTIQPLEHAARLQLETELHPDSPQRIVSAASQLLADLTRFAGVVATPERASTTFRQVEFLRLSEKRVLLIF